MLRLRSFRPLAAAAVAVVLVHARATAQSRPDTTAAAAAILKADADFAESVAQRNRERFLTFLADVTTFNGGTPGEIHGRDTVMKEWADFFEPGGPTLTWTPTKGEVVGAGDLGYTTGQSIFRARAADGTVQERHGEYLTVWRKQRDGSWKVVFDTGSTLPPR
jgi:ketosteroid isomerase-like protein